MRRDIEGLRTPYPLATMLPAYLQEDQLVVRVTAGLDDVLAPVVSALDCLEAYVDPRLSPEDFLTWLAAWVGATLDDHWSDERRRACVLAAAELHRQRGTVEGLRRLLALATGGDVTVDEVGGVTWSTRPTPRDEQPVPSLAVTVAVDDPVSVRRSVLEDLVRSAKPAHVPHTIEVVSR
jgi:phage tail-like protein